MKIAPMINRFTFGEVSPLLSARGDLSKYNAGCKELVNFIPLLQGPVRRRGGTRFIAKANNGAKPVALLRFAFSETTTYIIEAGDKYLRFYKDGAPVLSGAAPYQIASPWGQADLFLANGICALKYVQSGDVMYIVCPGRPPKKLMRYGHTDWRIETLPGWGSRPNASAVALWRERLCLASGQTLYFSQAGAFDNFEVAVKSVPGAIFRALNTAAPIVVDNAKGSAEYSYLSAGILVTATVGWPADEATASLSSANHVVTITPSDAKKGISRIGFVATMGNETPLNVSVNSLTGVITAKYGSSSIVTYASLQVDPQKTSIYVDSAASSSDGKNQGYIVRGAESAIAADDPMEINVYSEQMDKIEWLCPSSSLLVGTTGGEFIVGETTTADPLGPENIKVAPETAFGSSPIQALRVGAVILFVQRAGRKVREFVYDYAGDNYLAMDVTVAAEHITQGGLTALAWQSEPIETLWAVRPDGQLIGFTYSKDQDMTAWHRHRLGGDGAVSQIAVIPAAHGGRDELWLSVRRSIATGGDDINGQTVYYIERMEHGHEPDENQAEAFFVDAGTTIRGSALTQITGLAHLDGREVAVLADGGVQPGQTVKDGAITLRHPADVVHVGLPYDSVLTTVNLEAALQDGTAQGRLKRFTTATLRLVESLGGAAGHCRDSLEPLEYRRGSDVMDRAVPLVTDDVRVAWPHGYETEGQLTVVQEYPLPFILAAIIADVNLEGKN